MLKRLPDDAVAGLGQDPRVADLKRLKALALGLLMAMLSGFLISHWQGGQGGWAWVAAFCEAAAIGALADWFAVTALFRRPLGLAIPHTAIIPANKDRIAESLGDFISHHFLRPEMLTARLAEQDLAARLGDWLSEPERARKVATLARTWAIQGLAFLDEESVRKELHAYVAGQLQRWNGAGAVGDLLVRLTEGDRHQAVLDDGLLWLGRRLNHDKVKARASRLIVGHLRANWPRLSSALGLFRPLDSLGDGLAERLASEILAELQAILVDPEHRVRQDYEVLLAGYIQRLRFDPALGAWVARLKQGMVDHPALRDYVEGLWTHLQASLRKDLERDDSALVGHLQRQLEALGRSLASNPELRAALNHHLLDGMAGMSNDLGGDLARHIARTVKAWPDDFLVAQVEVGIGRDLQFIRFNGTLVGGLIGLALHAMTTWMGS